MSSDRPQERLFRGDGGTYDDAVPLPEAPPWRRPRPDDAQRRPYLIGADQVEVVNAALRLRRPLLVTGAPGTGKSSLAHAVAAELGLGPVLVWPVNTRATLTDALYRYDAIGRLRERQEGTDDIGSFVRLGPLGTALATRHEGRPRLLLIDELDKSDLDLPNDLLFVLEEGEFTVPELARLPEQQAQVDVHVQGSQDKVRVRQGTVRCQDFPFVVITSNGEREFPPAFLRRCVRLELPEPDQKQLERIVRAHFSQDLPELDAQWPRVEKLVSSFITDRDARGLATDQLLHAVHLLHQGVHPEVAHLRKAVLRELRSGGVR
ncbi:AAA family ATPase [Streptomyces sp. NPDC001414]